jgi:hypothetical protein
MNGQTQVVNKCLETYLRCFSSAWKNRWAQWSPLAGWWYNTSYHTTTRMIPFESVYGQKPPSVLSYMPRVLKVQQVDTNLTVYVVILHSLKDNFFTTQNRMKQQVSQGNSEHVFVEGD